MSTTRSYDIAIIGGGLAGLALSIQCVRSGYSAIVFEKEKYPFHKVCGEYISLESWNFLQELGVPLSDMQLPLIRKLLISSPDGRSIEHDLPLGGFGISRYALDHLLAEIAKKEGATVLEATKVTDAVFRNNSFLISSAGGDITARVAAGCFGKRSNLDVKWKRPFIHGKRSKLNHYIAVKYHIRTEFPEELIALHNFDNGYCGISRIEGNKYCLCYLTTADNLKKNNHDIKLMEEKVLMKNSFLKKIFTGAQFLYEDPLTISQVSFTRKLQVEAHVMMMGDSAGMITPLCGNGMSMALHSSKIAFCEIKEYLTGNINRHEMEVQYTQEWEKQFRKRLYIGRILQQFFGNSALTNLLIASLKPFPRVVSWLIRQTHGDPF